MTDTAHTEQQLRDHLARHTDGGPGGPDLDRSLRDGRRRRRTRSVGVAAAAVATAAVVGTVAVVGLTGDDGAEPGPATVADDEPAATDFVAGTTVDDELAAVVAERLPDLPEADDIYPSDADTAGPLPDAELGRATEWQAVYTAEPGHEVLVLMGLPVPGEDPADTCEGAGVPVAGCDVQEEPAGALLITQEYTTDDGFTFFTSQVDADGFRVSVLDTVATQDRARAVAGRIDEALVRDLVADQRLHFER